WNAAEGMFGSLVRLMILWGTRKGESGCMQRDWIVEDVLTIPGEFTKNGRPHAIPILPEPRKILDERLRASNSPYLFPARWNPEAHLNAGSWTKLVKALRTASGTRDWSVHDLRRTARSNWARLRVPRDVAEALLNHKGGALDQIYDQY